MFATRVRPVTDLRNLYPKVGRDLERGLVILTKNGHGASVLVSIASTPSGTLPVSLGIRWRRQGLRTRSTGAMRTLRRCPPPMSSAGPLCFAGRGVAAAPSATTSASAASSRSLAKSAWCMSSMRRRTISRPRKANPDRRADSPPCGLPHRSRGERKSVDVEV